MAQTAILPGVSGESTARQRTMQQRTEKIIAAALDLFCSNGLEDTTIEAVAKQAGVGPATIYRYFETKAELAVQCGISYWEKVSGQYLYYLQQPNYQSASGRDQMAVIFQIFTTIFEEEYLFFKFLQEFDVFARSGRIPPERLAAYEACILNLKPYMTNALEKGLTDGSLSFSYPVDEVYFTVTHALLALMQKLASTGKILQSDERVALAVQVKITGELLLAGLQGCKNFTNRNTQERGFTL